MKSKFIRFVFCLLAAVFLFPRLSAAVTVMPGYENSRKVVMELKTKLGLSIQQTIRLRQALEDLTRNYSKLYGEYKEIKASEESVIARIEAGGLSAVRLRRLEQQNQDLRAQAGNKRGQMQDIYNKVEPTIISYLNPGQLKKYRRLKEEALAAAEQKKTASAAPAAEIAEPLKDSPAYSNGEAVVPEYGYAADVDAPSVQVSPYRWGAGLEFGGVTVRFKDLPDLYMEDFPGLFFYGSRKLSAISRDEWGADIYMRKIDGVKFYNTSLLYGVRLNDEKSLFGPFIGGGFGLSFFRGSYKGSARHDWSVPLQLKMGFRMNYGSALSFEFGYKYTYHFMITDDMKIDSMDSGMGFVSAFF